MLGVGNRIHLMAAIAKHDFVQRVSNNALVLIGMKICSHVTIHGVEGDLLEIVTMVFSDDDNGCGTTQWAALFLGAQAKQQLIPRLFVRVPPSDQTGQSIGEQTKTSVVLLKYFHSIGFVVGIDRGVQTDMPDER